MIAVGGPIENSVLVRFAAHDDDRVEEAAELGDDGFELAHVSIGKIALIGRWFDLLDRQRSHDQPLAAKRLAITADHSAAIFLDGALQTFNSRGSCAGKFVRHQSGGFSCQLTSLTRCAGFLFGFLLRHVTCSACLTHRSYCSNRQMLGRNIVTASAIPATITPPKATAADAPLTSAITPPIMPPTGMSSQANP